MRLVGISCSCVVCCLFPLNCVAVSFCRRSLLLCVLLCLYMTFISSAQPIPTSSWALFGKIFIARSPGRIPGKNLLNNKVCIFTCNCSIFGPNDRVNDWCTHFRKAATGSCGFCLYSITNPCSGALFPEPHPKCSCRAATSPA